MKKQTFTLNYCSISDTLNYIRIADKIVCETINEKTEKEDIEESGENKAKREVSKTGKWAGNKEARRGVKKEKEFEGQNRISDVSDKGNQIEAKY